MPILFYDDFDDGNYDGWTASSPIGPVVQTGPDVVASPEGWALRGVGSGYTDDAGLRCSVTHPLSLSNIGALKFEMRAKSGPQWPNSPAMYLLDGTDYYGGQDYGESNRRMDLYVNISGGNLTYMHGIGNRAYEWHDFAWTRNADGQWSMSVDGVVEAPNVTQNNVLTSFDNLTLHILRNQSEIEWVRISGDPVTGPALPGDANRNGFVDDDDLAILLGNWTGPFGTGRLWETGDFEGDCDVADDDLNMLLSNWTGAPPAGASVPEPATLSLLALGGLAAMRRKRPGACGRRGAGQGPRWKGEQG